MQTKLAWPEARPTPRARFRSELDLYPPLDRLGLFEAAKLKDRLEGIQNSATTGTWTELMFTNTADYTAYASSNTEGSLLTGVNDQPVIPALFFFNKQGRFRVVRLEAEGVMGATGTPTFTFQVRLGTTSGASFLSGVSVGVSTTIGTTAQSAKYWYLQLTMLCQVAGIGTNNTTLSCAGYVTAPSIFNSPFIYPLEPTSPESGTWTQTIDNAVTQYVNLSVTASVNSASNTVTCKALRMFGYN